MPSFDAFYAWSQECYAWAKEWQFLIAGLLTVFAACIFTVGTITAARIRAGTSAKSSRPDLRMMTGAANDDADAKLVGTGITTALNQLRWLIRSALSPQLFGSNSRETMVRCCERIFQLNLKTSPLPAEAPNALCAQSKAIVHDINALRELVENQAATSEIVSALIKLNASAREMASSLSGDNNTPATTSAF